MSLSSNIKRLPAPERIRASLDVVSRAGTVEGWAFYLGSPAICHVQVHLNGVEIASDLADKFRPDLLRAGFRHGHCAFYARIKSLEPGKHPLRLIDGRTGSLIGGEFRDLYEVPPFDPIEKENIEALLRSHGRWQDDDLLSDLGMLELQGSFETMGPERFVNRVFRFVLGRWADPPAVRHYTNALLQGDLTPNDVLRAVLTSDERQLHRRPLARPMDPDFPFGLIC